MSSKSRSGVGARRPRQLNLRLLLLAVAVPVALAWGGCASTARAPLEPAALSAASATAPEGAYPAALPELLADGRQWLAPRIGGGAAGSSVAGEATDGDMKGMEGMEGMKGMEGMGSEKTEAPTYVCPMHPEVHSDHPGTCPKCGMTLEKKPAGEGKP